jgi:Mg-chelatase subunit ChlD
VLSVIAVVFGWLLFMKYYEPPSCFDGKQNAEEAGVDCGGECAHLCEHQFSKPVVLFSRSFEVAGGVYSSVAYVENPNFDIGVEGIGFVFKLYDSSNRLVATKEGTTFIAAGKISPIFVGGIRTEGGVEPTRTVFELLDSKEWKKVAPSTDSPFLVKDVSLTDASNRPRLFAVVENKTVNEYKDIEVVTVIYNANKNAIATSRTFIDIVPKKGQKELVFTWPEPLAIELEACTVPVDVMLLLDTSGSMNNDGVNPPQPLTDAKNAAAEFLARLSEDDRAGLITFATNAQTLQRFSENHQQTINILRNVSILPEEEVGSTNTGAGILNATRALQTDSLNRSSVEKVMVLLTDGIANEPEEPGGEPYALSQARLAKQIGYRMYTIGLGSEVNAEFLRELATTPLSPMEQYFYRAGTSKELIGIYENISDAICERGAAIIEIIPRIPDRVVE